jgi:hypothetical protein
MTKYMRPATRTRRVKQALHQAQIPTRNIYSIEGGATWVIPHYEMEAQTAKALTAAGYTVEQRNADGNVPAAVLVPADNFVLAGKSKGDKA